MVARNPRRRQTRSSDTNDYSTDQIYEMFFGLKDQFIARLEEIQRKIYSRAMEKFNIGDDANLAEFRRLMDYHNYLSDIDDRLVNQLDADGYDPNFPFLWALIDEVNAYFIARTGRAFWNEQVDEYRDIDFANLTWIKG